MSKLAIRTNGRGNAWPSFLGQEHPFYNVKDSEDMANASFSIISFDEIQNINWSVLVDAGHGAIQYLLKNENRIPEAIFLTHPHHDHTYSIDWVVQSKYRTAGGKYPLYCTRACYEFVIQSYPHLSDLIEYNELEFGKTYEVTEVEGLTITVFPAYHGPSALGASILLFEINSKKMLFTGDILFPMVLNQDIERISNVDVLYVDSNNRFADPSTNHWSIVSEEPNEKRRSSILNNWLNSFDVNSLGIPHKIDGEVPPYVARFIIEVSKDVLIPSIFDFAKKITPKSIGFIHYSGAHDMDNYTEEILSENELLKWIIQAKENRNFDAFIPEVGNYFYL